MTRLTSALAWVIAAVALLTTSAPDRAVGSADVVTGEFAPLQVAASHHGVLKVTLDAAARKIMLGGVAVDALTFNGDYAAPVLRVRPGDQLRIHLLNHTAQLMNLHFHGFHASPLGGADNVHAVVKPEQAFDYRIDIPSTQPPGMYWYHTHIHGLAEDQINRGLSGAIIIEGVDRRAPEVAGVKETEKAHGGGRWSRSFTMLPMS